MDCATCERVVPAEPLPRWKAPLLFVAALLFCPCHLPATFAVIATLGVGLTGAAWFFANKALVYGVFSLIYVASVVLLFRWLMRRRDLEKAAERFHQEHATQA